MVVGVFVLTQQTTTTPQQQKKKRYAPVPRSASSTVVVVVDRHTIANFIPPNAKGDAVLTLRTNTREHANKRTHTHRDRQTYEHTPTYTLVGHFPWIPAFQC